MISFVYTFFPFLMWNKVNGVAHTNEWAVHIDGGDDTAQEIANEHDFDIISNIFHDTYLMRHKRLVRRSTEPHLEHHDLLVRNPAVVWAEQQIVKRRVKRGFKSGKGQLFNDPKWPEMWFLKPIYNMDMNVLKAWNSFSVTGKGIVVSILDDGLERVHPDLINNFDPDASCDVNDHKSDPMPRYDYSDFNKHGTRCAGEVAAEGNNSICSVGIAYEASIGGVRMLDGDITDSTEAESLSFNPQHIDIYSASWGPDDDGRVVDGPGKLTKRAFTEGISQGRQGKGSIFVWASGNGGRDYDNCNCDGYSNSIWTLSVSSVTERGKVPWYAEFCTSTMATTFSSGSRGDRKIITTDLHSSCTTEFTGTSASAPLAAAICALVLEANTALTWRDIQHIVQKTARPDGLIDPDWRKNGVGRLYSHYFGFGLMDAYAMVKLAKTWTTVSEQNMCEIFSNQVPVAVPKKGPITLDLEVKKCPGVNFIEHIQSKLSIASTRRGSLEIFLFSPSGTKSKILAKRPHDRSNSGFRTWPFMTLHMWGENPKGNWKLKISQEDDIHDVKSKINQWSLVIYGTSDKPGFSDEYVDISVNIKMPNKNNLSATNSSKNKIISVSSSASKAYLGNMTLLCEKPFISVGKKCLHISSTSQTWRGAQAYCEAHHSQLAEITNFNDFEFDSIFKDVHTNGVWVGGRKHKDAGEWWLWNSGRRVSPYHWKYGHPLTSRHPRDVSKGSDEDVSKASDEDVSKGSDRCLLLDPDSYHFSDHSCQEEWQILCERN